MSGLTVRGTGAGGRAGPTRRPLIVVLTALALVVPLACSDDDSGPASDERRAAPAPAVDVVLARSASTALTIAEPGGGLAGVLAPGPDGEWLIAGRSRDADAVGRPVLWRSPDGLTWAVEQIDPASDGNFAVDGLARWGATVVVVGREDLGTGHRGAVWVAGEGERFTRVDGDEFEGPFTTVETVAGGPDGFVATGSTGTGGEASAVVWRSSDGRRWHRDDRAVELLGDGHDASVSAVAMRDGAAVMAGTVAADATTDAAVWFSPGGDRWERVESDSFTGPGAQAITDVTVAGTAWLASGRVERDGTMTPAIWRSDDGRTWQLVRSTFHLLDRASSTWGVGVSAVRAVNGQYVAVGSAAAARIWQSADGVTWTEVEVPDDLLSSVDYELAGLALAAPDDLVAISGPASDRPVVLRRRPGEPVTEVTATTDVFPPPSVKGSVTGVDEVGDQLLAWGARYTAGRRIGELTEDGLVWRSTDGLTWEKVAADPVFARGWVAEIVASNGVSVAVGGELFDLGGGAGNPDPLVWVEEPDDEWQRLAPADAFPGLVEGEDNVGIHAVLDVGEQLVAVGRGLDVGDVDARIWTSPDGRRWSSMADAKVLGGAGDQAANDVCAVDGGQVAVGGQRLGGQSSVVAWHAIDGGPWARAGGHATPADRSESMEACATTSAGVVAVGSRRFSDGTVEAGLWSTTDGRAWSPVESAAFQGGDSWMRAVAADGDLVVAAGTDERVESGEPALWVSRNAGRSWRRLTVNLEAVRGRESQAFRGVHLRDGRLTIAGSVDGSPAIWSGRLE